MKAVWLAKLCATVALSAVASFHSTLSEGPSDNPYGFPADPINYDDPLGLFGIQPLKYDSPPNPYAELVNAMNRFDAGLHEFAGAIAGANVSTHYGLLNAINAPGAAASFVHILDVAAYRNQTMSEFVNGLTAIGQNQGRQNFYDQPVPITAGTTRPATFGERWTMDSARIFERHLIGAAEASTFAIPGLGLGRSAGVTGRAIAHTDFMADRMGGELYAAPKLAQLEAYLGRRGFTLRVGDQFLPEGRAGGFNAVEKAISLRSNPTQYEVWHELAHFRQFQRIGPEAYNNLSRVDREQAVFDMLNNSPRRWNNLTFEQQQHAIDYIQRLGGIR